MEEAVKQLTPLISTRPDWSYTLVHLNKNACHAPLPKEGHLNVLVEGSTSSVTCGRISQLEFHQLLSLGSQAIYVAGLNGCEVPVIMSLPESLGKGATMLPFTYQWTFHNPQWRARSQSPVPWQSLISHPDHKFHQGFSTQGRRTGQHDHRSEGAPILGSVRHLWAHIREFHPKEARTHGLSHTPTPQTRRFPQTGGYILPRGHCRWCQNGWPHPRGDPCHLLPTIKTPGPSSDIPPTDIAHLWEEVNKALGDWLVIKSSIDAHQWKLVSEFSMTLCQNKSKTEESIKEAKALCSHSIREAEANCAHSIKEAEICCSTAIREAETWGAS